MLKFGWMAEMDKYALEFQFYKDGNKIELDGGSTVIGSTWSLSETLEFEYEYWDSFKDEEKLKELEDGYYHVFEYGSFSYEWSEHPEFGREFDGVFLYEELQHIEFMGDLIEN